MSQVNSFVRFLSVGCIGFVLTFECAAATSADEILELRLKALAGSDAINCRIGRVKENDKASTDCALNAFARKKPFYIFYGLVTIDVPTVGGLAFDGRDRMKFALFSDAGWSPDERRRLRKEARIVEDGKILLEDCPTPAQLYKTKSGRLTCFPAGPDSVDPW